MPTINLKNVTFSHAGSAEKIFDNLCLNIDTGWRLGLIGRNGKGKTTLLKLILGEYEYEGEINCPVNFTYFPIRNLRGELTTRELFESEEKWRLEIEATKLSLDVRQLDLPYERLSKGEQTKAQLALLFACGETDFILIDEPTNHLDSETRKQVAKYLKQKAGFILVSHDRRFLDECADHILALNRQQITLSPGNFTSWLTQKQRQDDFERAENMKLEKQITKLEFEAWQKTDWANRTEASKYHPTEHGSFDRGYIGAQSARIMKRATIAKKRRLRAIEQKSKLLKNVETIEKLKIQPLPNTCGRLIDVTDLSFAVSGRQILNHVNFYVENGDRLRIKGRNGCGKTTLFNILLGKEPRFEGKIIKPGSLKISYLPQDTSFLCGTLKDFAIENQIDENLLLTMLRKLDFSRNDFNQNLQSLSEGSKKKILIAKSLATPANLYLWDEPLNYLDIFLAQQIKELWRETPATLIFVEHDEEFSSKIATKTIELQNAQLFS